MRESYNRQKVVTVTLSFHTLNLLEAHVIKSHGKSARLLHRAQLSTPQVSIERQIENGRNDSDVRENAFSSRAFVLYLKFELLTTRTTRWQHGSDASQSEALMSVESESISISALLLEELKSSADGVLM